MVSVAKKSNDDDWKESAAVFLNTQSRQWKDRNNGRTVSYVSKTKEEVSSS